ncbi:uncharacterized protein LOC143828948 [Paroedura picta]|uniref:uncharacterized protein LOC143828948 n=1 Tax=Paroedura picta TaxID=143630 RepID=UPI0040575E1B
MERLIFQLLAYMLAVLQRMNTALSRRTSAIAEYRERVPGTLTSSRRRSVRVTMAAKKRWQALAEVRFPRQFWVDERSSDWWENFVWTRWDDDHWIANFRMSRGTFFELVEALRGRMERQVTGMRRPVPVEKRVAAALWYLATPQYFRTVAQQFGLGVTTVGDILKEFCLAMEAELFSKVVCLGDRLGASMDGFARLGFPHCFAAVDGSHIPIRAPGGSIKEYGNRKDFCSVLLQGTVDFSGRFIDAEVGWSGRRHDALVFRESNLRKAMDEGVFVPGNPTATIEGVHLALQYCRTTLVMRLDSNCGVSTSCVSSLFCVLLLMICLFLCPATQSPSKLATAPEREEGEEEGPSTSGQAAAETVEARLRAMEARVTSLEAQVAELKGEIEQQRQQREAEELKKKEDEDLFRRKVRGSVGRLSRRVREMEGAGQGSSGT